ncbi:leucine-rich repeat-containing protein 42-like [Terrapene carolina triunguis]|uniref:leucine-rich repeat-containing protein 42-like n=1 Tax=Terrapene triunguis TaxID=2587831 RepID=UPI0011567833|nr:leucine-rich repeat-containing protein 42-like [Terrapene carolina triunguis]
MSYCLKSESLLDTGPIYVRENGHLYMVNQGSGTVKNATPKPRPFRLFSKGFSVELCMNRDDDSARRERTDHFIFTYTKEGNLRYSAKSLFGLVLGYISDNVDHIDSLIGFPEQIAEKLFSAAEARQKFTEPVTGLRALQKFTEAYGSLVLCSLCLQNRYLVISEKLEEIKSFRELTCLDLSCCKLGDNHELLEHITKEALSSVTRLLLKDNCLSDAGLRKMTAPVRVMKRGLENLSVLDLSCNPEITDTGIGYLFSFKKLNYLDISETGLKDVKAVIQRLQTQISLVHSKVPLKEFDHSNCKTEGWAEQVCSFFKNFFTKPSMCPFQSQIISHHPVRFYIFLVFHSEKTDVIKSLENEHVLHSYMPEEVSRGCIDFCVLGFFVDGKRRRIEEPVKCTLVQTKAKASENLQFYKDKVQNCHFPLLKKEAAACHQLKKNKEKRLTEQERERTSKQKHTCLTMEDWDLLNTY